MAGARNIDYSDQEILYALDAVVDAKGWAKTEEIGERLGVPSANIGIRLGWMKRYGFVLNDKGVRGQWKITARGLGYRDAQLSAGQKQALKDMKKEDTIELMRILGERYEQSKDALLRVALRRQFQHHTVKR